MARDLQREIQSVKDSVSKITGGQRYIIRTDAIKRDLDAVNPTTANNAKVLATLISDLKKLGILGE